MTPAIEVVIREFEPNLWIGVSQLIMLIHLVLVVFASLIFMRNKLSFRKFVVLLLITFFLPVLGPLLSIFQIKNEKCASLESRHEGGRP